MNFKGNNQYDELIKQAGNSIGADPNSLKQQIDSGKLDALLQKMRPDDAQRFKQILGNPQLAQQMLSSPQAQELIRKFMK